LSNVVGEVGGKQKVIGQELKTTKTVTEQVGKATNTWRDGIIQSVESMIKYALGVRLVYAAIQEVQDGIQYIVDLNKQMVDIQIATGLNKEEVGALAVEYNGLAKEMGATTLEVSKSAVTWLKQGKSVEDSQKLIQGSLMLSKLGLISTAESSEYLTSILNGYQLQVEDVIGVLDKFVSVDNASATSVAELATALQYSANVARDAGVDFEHLTAYVATVSSVTRRSAETVGQAFKTMFSRMADIQRGAIDEVGVDINQVERALGRVGIALREDDKTFRNFQDVLEDLSKSWKTYDDITRADIAKTIAGVRQREIFIALLENQTMVQEMLNIQTDSAGLALDRYGMYLEGVEAKQNKFTATWESLWQTTITSDSIGKMYDLGAAVLKLIEDMGGLIPVAQGIITVLVLLNAKFLITQARLLGIGITTLISNLSAFFSLIATGTPVIQALNVALGTTQVVAGAVVLAVAAVGLAINKIKEFSNDFKTLVEENANVWKEQFAKMDEDTKTSEAVLGLYEKKLKDVRSAIESAGIAAKIFGSGQKTIENGLKEVLSVIAETSITYDEYITNSQKAAEMAGYNIDEQGRLHRTFMDGKVQLTSYIEGVQLLTQADFLAGDSSGYLADKLARANAKMKEGVKELPALTENFQKFLELTYKAKDTTSEAFDIFIGGLRDTNRLFQEGLLDSGAYFDQLEQSLKDINISEMFGDDKDAAQTFFAGLTTNAAESLSFINTKFENGEISITKYTEQLAQLGDVFGQIARLAEGFLGPDNAVTQALSSMTTGVDELRQAQELNIIVQNTLRQVTQENLEFGTEGYKKQMELVAAAAEQSGLIFKDVNGRVLEGRDQILQYLTEADGNMVKLADQSANQTGEVIETVVQAIGNMLVGLGEAIDKFDATISFKPSIKGEGVKLPGILGNLIQLPEFGYDIGANIGDLFKGIGAKLQEFKSADLGIDLDASIYTKGFDTADDEMKSLIDTSGSLADSFDKAGDSAKALQDLLNMVVAMLKQQKEAQKEALQDELDNYKRIIDARKKIIDQEKEDLDFQRKLEDKQKSAARIQAEIEELKLDNSEAAKKRRLELEEELAKLKEQINNDIQDENIEKRKDALDEDYKKFEDIIKGKIDIIDEYLKQPGLIVADAIALINQHSGQLYQDLMEWNRVYGTGVDADVIGTWNKAYDVLLKYKDMLGEINYQLTQIALLKLPDFPEYPGGYNYQPIPKLYHEGGPVGGLSANEEFAKLMKGEWVLNEAQMDKLMNIKIPNMLSAKPTPTGGTGLNIGKLIEINSSGNLDKSIIPEIEKIAKKVVDELNDAMGKRGFNRTANTFSI